MTRIMIPRGKRGPYNLYTHEPDGVNDTEYSAKELRHGVMTNVRVAADNHMLLRELAAKGNTTMNTLVNNVLAKAYKTQGWRKVTR